MEEEGQLTEAVEALVPLVELGYYVSASVFYLVLKRSMQQRDLDLGMRLHSLIFGSGYESNTFLANHLIRMYASHGRLDEAMHVFTNLQAPNAFVWLSVILAHFELSNSEQAIKLYEQMRDSKVKPDNYVFVAVLRACASIGDLASGKQVHADILNGIGEVNVFVGSSLVDMYTKCGSLENACSVFDGLPAKDVVTWTAMMAGYAEHGLGEEALSVYQRMQQEGITPADDVTYACLLKACATAGAMREGIELHYQMQERGLEADGVLGNSLVDMYAKCGNLEYARQVFDKLRRKDVVAWTSLIAGYAQSGLGQESLRLYASMQLERITPADQITFACLLKACGSMGALHEGKQIHCQIQSQGLEGELVVGSSLVDMYSKCGSLEDARAVFDRLPNRDVVAWTAMIAAYAQQGLGQESLMLYESMQQEGISSANRVTYVCLLKACGCVGALHQGKELHFEIQQRGLEKDVIIGNSLVDMYAKCGSLGDARRVFDRLSGRDVVTWTAMISGYAERGLGQEALTLHQMMQQEGISLADGVTFATLLKACASLGLLQQGKELHREIQRQALDADVVIGNCLVDMYAKCGSLQDAREVFDGLTSKDVVTWTVMIAGYANHALGQEALALYGRMEQEGMKPVDPVTVACLLKACASIGALDQGKGLHSQILDRGLDSDVGIGNCLVDMYAKCGSLKDCCSVFDKMLTKDMVTWSAMIAAYAQHGRSLEAFQCYEKMQEGKVRPDGVTFLSLLSACSHAGSVARGVEYFNSMSQEFGITPEIEHYVSMVDLFGRSGSFERIQDMLSTMPVQPDLALWVCLLGACRKHGNVALGEQAFASAVQLQPQHGAAYVLMSHIYADAGLLDCALEVQAQRQKERAWKHPGRSWIQHGQEVHSFTVHDRQHPLHQQLHSLLEKVRSKIRQSGRTSQTPNLIGSQQDCTLPDKQAATEAHFPHLVAGQVRAAKSMRLYHSATKLLTPLFLLHGKGSILLVRSCIAPGLPTAFWTSKPGVP